MSKFLSRLVLFVMATILVAACTPGKPIPPPNIGGGVVPLSATAVEIPNDLQAMLPMIANPFPLLAQGGTPPYTYSHTGILPVGLSYSESTGEVSGTPTVVSLPVSLVFSVKDASGAVASTTSTVVFTIHSAPTFSISGRITGGTQGGVLLTATPGGKTATSLPDGTYSFSGFVSGAYTVTPSLAGVIFTPASRQVTVNGANVTGVNFDTPVPVLSVGKLMYPCIMAICEKDLSIGAETVLWGGFNVWPDTLAVTRVGRKVAFSGSNIGGIVILSLDTLTVRFALGGEGFLTSIAGNPECTSWAEEFDISETGDFVATSNRCFLVGFPEKRDIFLVKTDGTAFNVRVTNDTAFDTSPIVCSPGGVASAEVSICFVRNGTEIWRQVVSPVNDLLVGSPTLIASNVMGDMVRPMSVNRAYTHLVYTKNVGGAPHIVVVTLAGGAEVDLGVGQSPHWSLDGSDLILFTGAEFPRPAPLWTMKADGTGRASVPPPSNLLDVGLQGGAGKVVFAP